MKVLILSDNYKNAYIASLMKAYKKAQCEVVTCSLVDFFLSNYIPDVLHIHWPEGLYKKDQSLFGEPEKVIPERLNWYRENGAKIIFTVHNICPHNSKDKARDYFFYNCIIEKADILVHHGSASVNLLAKHHPIVQKKHNIICKHGDYLIQYKNLSKEQARLYLKLPLNKMILLHFGNIKKYKGFQLMRQIYRKWHNKNKYFLVAGHYEKPKQIIQRLYEKFIFNVEQLFCGCRYDFRSIPNKEVAYYFSAADIIVLTHTSGLTSGILAMAATFKKPVIYPAIGNFTEQVEKWVAKSYPVKNVSGAIEALNYIESYLDKGLPLDNTKWLAENSWDLHVSKILSHINDYL